MKRMKQTTATNIFNPVLLDQNLNKIYFTYPIIPKVKFQLPSIKWRQGHRRQLEQVLGHSEQRSSTIIRNLRLQLNSRGESV